MNDPLRSAHGPARRSKPGTRSAGGEYLDSVSERQLLHVSLGERRGT
jgi:hypothetical protein